LEKKEMSKGKAKYTLLGIQGIVGHKEAPDWSFIYETSLIRDSKWHVGDVVELPNGKGFVYCKSGGACYTGQGNALLYTKANVGIPYNNNVAADAAIGAKKVVVTNGSIVDLTEDSLRGGTILFKTVTGSDNSALQSRGIIGNTAAVKGAACTIYLDAPLTGALTTASYSYCLPSPYMSVGLVQVINTSKIGVAATYVSAANMYHWEQFKGRVMGLATTHAVGRTAHGTEVVWRDDGSVQLRGLGGTASVDGENQQVAGYVMDRTDLGNGETEIMLTGNV